MAALFSVANRGNLRQAMGLEGRNWEDWVSALPQHKIKGGELVGPCPACGGTDRFHVRRQNDMGGVLVGCRGCIDGQPTSARSEQFLQILKTVFGEPSSDRFRTPPKRVPVSQPAAVDTHDLGAIAVARRLWSAGEDVNSKPVRAYLNRRLVWPSQDAARAVPSQSMRWLGGARARELLPLAKGRSPWPDGCAGALMCAFKTAEAEVRAVSLEGLRADGTLNQPDRFRRTYGRREDAWFAPVATNGLIVMCEGEMNALACVALGFLGRDEYVDCEPRAYGGTASLVKAVLPVGRPVFALIDGDKAGGMALEQLLYHNPDVYPEMLPRGHDAASLLAEDVNERISVHLIERGLTEAQSERLVWAPMLECAGNA